jgi:ribosome-associated protein
MEPLEKALLCLKLINERKAIDPVLLEVNRLTSITDYFLVTSGNSTRQVQAISQHLSGRMKEEGFRPFGVEGEAEGHWVLMDYGEVVVHIFYHPLREFYDLEGLWVEAPRIGSSGTEKKRNATKQDP